MSDRALVCVSLTLSLPRPVWEKERLKNRDIQGESSNQMQVLIEKSIALIQCWQCQRSNLTLNQAQTSQRAKSFDLCFKLSHYFHHCFLGRCACVCVSNKRQLAVEMPTLNFVPVHIQTKGQGEKERTDKRSDSLFQMTERKVFGANPITHLFGLWVCVCLCVEKESAMWELELWRTTN